MKDLIKFEFEGKGVRAGVDADGEPFWIGKDVCDSLGFKSHNKTLSRLDDDERGGVTICHPLGGRQEMATINEAGLYTLIIRSNKPEAKTFRRWITHEVLPALRRTGGYAMPQEAPEAKVEITADVLSWRHRCIEMDMRAAVARTRLTWPEYERINFLRDMGLTQYEAGKLYDVSRDTVARLERFHRRLYETTYFLPGYPMPPTKLLALRGMPPAVARRKISIVGGGAR